MKTISEVDKNIEKNSFPIKVVQFGEGNFLRAFIDWQVQKMNQLANYKGSVAIVQPIERGMVEKLKQQDNRYTLLLEGLLNGEKIQDSEIITCISKSINPYKEYKEYQQLALLDSLEVIFSNTTEAGIAYNDTDKFEDQLASSFPAKLTQFLYYRFEGGKKGLHIIPCELINHNGNQLKKYILQYAHLWELPKAFIDWIEQENYFYSTLVDRIVPGFPRDNQEEVFSQIGYEDPLLVKAEPFHLFVIEGNQKLKAVLPFEAAKLNIILTDDMQPYRERKVRLLNGPHTTMTPIGLLAGFHTVGEVMSDKEFSKFINDEMYYEIAPVIDLPQAELTHYIEAVKERFANPFVKHELISIALNSISKYRTRLLPTLLAQLDRGVMPKRIVLALAALLTIYRGNSEVKIVDTDEVVSYFEEINQKGLTEYVTTVLSCEKLWGLNLTTCLPLVSKVEKDMVDIRENGIYEKIMQLNREGE